MCCGNSDDKATTCCGCSLAQSATAMSILLLLWNVSLFIMSAAFLPLYEKVFPIIHSLFAISIGITSLISVYNRASGCGRTVFVLAIISLILRYIGLIIFIVLFGIYVKAMSEAYNLHLYGSADILAFGAIIFAGKPRRQSSSLMYR